RRAAGRVHRGRAAAPGPGHRPAAFLVSPPPGNSRRGGTMTRTLRLPALEVRQGGHTLYCFAVDGKLLERFTAVSRIHRGGGDSALGYQRPEILRHVAQIRQYLEPPGALMPNALVVAFDREVRFTPAGKGTSYSRPGTLALPLGGDGTGKVGWLVDGQ